MNLSLQTRPKSGEFQHSTALTGVIQTLEGIAEEMLSDGLETEAAGLQTTINDLQWQYEDVIDKELLGQWPNGPRRPARGPLRIS